MYLFVVKHFWNRFGEAKERGLYHKGLMNYTVLVNRVTVLLFIYLHHVDDNPNQNINAKCVYLFVCPSLNDIGAMDGRDFLQR